MAYQNCYKAIARRWHFPPKLIEDSDGFLIDVTPEPGRSYTRETWPPRGRGRGESLTSPRRIEARLRSAQVIRLRIEGHTWQTIAQALGYRDASGPWRAVRRTIDRIDRDAALMQAMQHSTYD